MNIEGLDLGTFFFFVNHRAKWLDNTMAHLTALGNSETLIVASVISAVTFLVCRERRAALLIAVAGLGGWGLSETSKAIVNRPRPELAAERQIIPLPGNASYPSGHALIGMSVYGTMGLLLARRTPQVALKGIFTGVGFAIPLILGLSRMYLGVHYLSDVIGGLCAGLALVLLLYALDSPRVMPEAEERLAHAT